MFDTGVLLIAVFELVVIIFVLLGARWFVSVQMSEQFNRRIRELNAILLDEGDEPIRQASIQAAEHFLNNPGITVTPTGDIQCRWKWPDGKRLVVRFVEEGSPWILKRPSLPAMSQFAPRER